VALKSLEEALPSIERAKSVLASATSDARDMDGWLILAQGLIEFAIQTAPELPLAHYREGEVRELRGEYERAEACWRRAVALDPSFGPAHYRLGRVLLGRAYLTSLVFWPDPRELRKQESEQLAREGAQEIERAQGSGFDNALQREIAGAMLAVLRNERPEARRRCAEAIRIFGRREGVEELHWLRGLVEEGDLAQIRAFDEAIALRPKFPLALYCRAGVRNHVGDRDGALHDYEETIRISPTLAEAYLHRGSTRWALKDAAGAYEDFDRLIRMGVLLPGAYNGRGRTLLELMGKIEEGIADLDHAITLQPDGYILPWMARAKAHLQLKHYEQAESDATKALSISKWGDVYAIRGLARAERGNRDGAIADLREAMKGTADPAMRARIEESLARLLKGS